MRKLLLLVSVFPRTELIVPEELLEVPKLNEYAPVTTESPPPYTFAPSARLLDDDDALQLVIVLVEKVKLLLLNAV